MTPSSTRAWMRRCTSSSSPARARSSSAPAPTSRCSRTPIRRSSITSASTRTRRCNRLEQTPKLVIAALNGHTVGGGLEVAMAADIRIARQGARQDRHARSRARRVARAPAARSGWRDSSARRKAIEMMATGSLFSFEEASEIGLVNHVWSDGELNGRSVRAGDPGLREAVHAAATRPAKAVGHIKRAVQTGLRDELLRRARPRA